MLRRFSACLLLAASAAGAADLPGYAQVRAAYQPSDATLLDRHGQPMQTLRLNLQVRRQAWAALADISPALPVAVLQAEDQRFMEHSGIDLRAMGQAAWDNLFRSRPRGASTITMQLAGLLDPSLRGGAGGRTLAQKWDQASAARSLDAQWTKAQVLEAYLNLASFRGELQGVGAAARGLFGKVPSGLNAGESAILAVLLRAPAASPQQVSRRACALVRELKSPLPCARVEAMASAAFARQAGMAVLPPAREAAQQLLDKPGQRVLSTLDARLQQQVQDILRRQVIALNGRNVSDAAAVVLDNATGEILAYAGNTGGSEIDGVAALRQAGSTLKPFLYGLAIERKLLTAASLLDDSPLEVGTEAGSYAPQNYDRGFKGYVSVRTSLASSLNVPAVRTVMLTGVDRFHERLLALGFDSLTEEAAYYGPALALGSAEVTLLQLANAYRALANGGIYSRPTWKPGQSATTRRVFDSGAAFIVGDILSDRAARSVTFGLKNELAATYWAAVKTGTSKDMRDNWCIGYSGRYTVGVWVGNFDGAPMWDVSGVTGAAPVWRDIMDYLHAGSAGAAPKPPQNVERQQLHYQPAVEAARGEWFLRGTAAPVFELVADQRRAPRILYPAEGAILAIDPDIPPAHQRVHFLAQGGRSLHWQLDGAAFGTVGEEAGWQPRAGKHDLRLLDGDGKELSRSSFTVRGPP